MSESIVFYLKSIFLGILSGYFSGQFGLGGGLITTPGIRLWLNESAAFALGTPLLIIIPAALTGVIQYRRKGFVDSYIARLLIISGLLGILVGASITAYVNLDLLMIITAIVILLVALLFLFRPTADILQKPEDEDQRKQTNNGLGVRLKCLISGLFTGFYSGLLGMGGGILLIPLLVYWFKFSIKKAFGTSLVINLFYAIPGAVMHYFLAHISIEIALWITLGVIPGAYVGARVTLGLSESLLKRLFGSFLFLVAAYFLIFEIRIFI